MPRLLRISKLNLHRSENLPLPLFAKEGYKSSLWQREVRRDFINNNNVVIMRPLIPERCIKWTTNMLQKIFQHICLPNQSGILQQPRLP
jgi:hypothetical protein